MRGHSVKQNSYTHQWIQMKHNHETTINAAALSVQWELPAPPLSNHPREQSGREWICILLCSEKRHLFIVRVRDGSSLLISIVETYVPFTRNPLPEKWKQPDREILLETEKLLLCWSQQLSWWCHTNLYWDFYYPFDSHNIDLWPGERTVSR